MSIKQTETNSLWWIFWTYLKIGCTSFGGFMSLISMVEKQLVDIDKKLKSEDILDAISLTSVLPGPVAVNVVVYTAYKLRGLTGALVAFIAIILPSFLLLILLSEYYFRYGDIPLVKSFFAGVTPSILALIITVGIQMAKKSITYKTQYGIVLLSCLLLCLCGGFLTTLLLIISSGIAGYFLFKETDVEGNSQEYTCKQWKGVLISLFLLLSLLFIVNFLPSKSILFQIFTIFSGISMTLFGGGYVVIPTLHELFVENLAWLSSSEFTDGIALGQITPGPIFITATFIGYKISGIQGAILATIAIFTPPACLTILAARSFDLVRNAFWIQGVLKGIRAAVIGMIFASVYILGQSANYSIQSIVLFSIALLVSYKYKFSPIYLILLSGMAGVILFSL